MNLLYILLWPSDLDSKIYTFGESPKGSAITFIVLGVFLLIGFFQLYSYLYRIIRNRRINKKRDSFTPFRKP